MPWVWRLDPELGTAGGLDFDYEGNEIHVLGAIDGTGRIYVLPEGVSVNIFGRLDPPYDEWFTMTGDPWQNMEGFGIAVTQNDKLVIIPQAGAGGARYDPTLDPGFAADIYSETPPEDVPWENTDGTYVSPASTWSTWSTILGGFYETYLHYFPFAVAPSGRLYLFGPRRDINSSEPTFTPPRTALNVATNYSGYLDPGDDHFIRIADLPATDTSDLNIEAMTAVSDADGLIYVAGGFNTGGATDAFRRYNPGDPVAAGIEEKQRIRITGGAVDPADTYQIINARDAFDGGGAVIVAADTSVTVQAAYDGYFGTSVVAVVGDGDDHTIEWSTAVVKPMVVVADLPTLNDTASYVEITRLIMGTGGPSTNTWTELDPLPEARAAGAMLYHDGIIYYVGGAAGGVGTATLFAYDIEAETWAELEPIPDGFSPTAVSDFDTTGVTAPVTVHNGRLYVPVLSYVTDAALQVRDYLFSPGSAQGVAPATSDPALQGVGPVGNPQPLDMAVPAVLPADITAEVTIDVVLYNIGATYPGVTDAPTFNVTGTTIHRSDDDIEVYDDATVHTVPAGHFTGARAEYQISFTDVLDQTEADRTNPFLYKISVATNAPGSTYRLCRTVISAMFHVPTGEAWQTRMARYDIAGDTWELSNPASIAHGRGGNVMTAAGRVYAIAGDDGA